MDKIEKIRQEIERRKGYISVTHFAEELLSFLDTLSEEPDKSLEEAAEEYEQTRQDTDARSDNEIVRRAFIAGAEWQEKQDLRWAGEIHKNGYNLCKEQMLKEAVEGEVIKTDKHTSVRYKSFYGTDRYFYGIADKQFKPGDKVRIVVLKAEEGSK